MTDDVAWGMVARAIGDGVLVQHETSVSCFPFLHSVGISCSIQFTRSSGVAFFFIWFIICIGRTKDGVSFVFVLHMFQFQGLDIINISRC